MNIRQSVPFAGCLVTLSLFGCGGGGGSQPLPPPQDVSKQTQQGQGQINSMLTGAVSTNSQNVATANSTFTDAYNKNKSDPQAMFGYAVSLVAVKAEAVIDSTQSKAVAVRPQNRATGASSTTLTDTASKTLFWNTPMPSEQTAASAASLVVAAPIAVANLSRVANADKVRAAVNDLKLALDTAIPIMDRLSANAAFTFPLQDRKGAFVIDQGDVKSFSAGLYVARAALNMVLAYNTSWGTFDFGAPMQGVLGSKINGLVAPNDYLPPAPFGTLESDGKSRFQAAQSDLSKAADSASSAVTILKARPAGTRHLIDAASWDAATIQNDITRFKQALTGAVTVNTTIFTNDGTKSVPVSINLNAWFTNPPSNLRALLPTWHGQDNGGNSFSTLQASKADYPDPTFGGLLTGLPDDNYNEFVTSDENIGALASKSLDTHLRLTK